MKNLNTLRRELEQKKGQKVQIEQDIETLSESNKENNRSLRRHEQAKEIVREVGMKTQQQIQYHISDITSLALEAVFDDPYQLLLEFVQRRNKTECDIFFVRDDKKVEPLTASGGGAVDVAAFALRIACWSLNRPHTRPTIILDEPMKWVSEYYKDKASEMIKQISLKLGIQIIMITHEPKLAAMADKVFEVSIKKGISKIT
jgi:DNA repair exonuclease SbcCD ATPase subunit